MRRLALLLILVLTPLSWAGTIELRATVRLPEGHAVTLADIASLTGPDAEALFRHPVTITPDRTGRTTIDAADIRRALSGTRTNWARLTLRGGPTTIVSTPPEPEPAARPDAPAPPPTIAPAPTGPTLRDAVERRIATLFALDPADLRITFDPRDADLLRTPTARRIADIQPTGSSDRLPLRITLYEGERIVLSEAIRVEVLARRATAVAARTIDRGARPTPADISQAEQWLPPAEPIASPADVLASAARGRIEAGSIIRAADLEPPILIKRGERVALHAVVGSVVLRTEARALRDARDGQPIELEALDGSRKRFLATVSGPGRAVINTNHTTIGMR